MEYNVVMNRKKIQFLEESDNFTLTFKNTMELISFFDWARKKSFWRNFQLNPYELASFGYFYFKGEVYCLNSPKDICGDMNWFSYNEHRKKIAEIRKVTNEDELRKIGYKKRSKDEI